MYALLSVYNKEGVVELGQALAEAGYRLISTGGTHAVLTEAGLEVASVSDFTGAPEILDGRVKTLHPKIHAGILANRGNPDHRRQMTEDAIEPIDVVVCNLYPFAEVVAREGCTLEEAVENIDIGGVAMLRAAAKNYEHVLVAASPDDYAQLAGMVRRGVADTQARRALALRAFRYTNEYDAAIAAYLGGEGGKDEEDTPMPVTAGGVPYAAALRYGENPHQQAALYAGGGGGVANAEQLHGIEPSYLNYLDADAAWEAVQHFGGQAAVIVKHASPCGIATRAEQAAAFEEALACDPLSAYGGIVGFNSALTAATVQAMQGTLLDVVVAPSYEPEALELLRKRKRTRVLRAQPMERGGQGLRSIGGGLLLQTAADEGAAGQFQVVTARKPSEEELEDLKFAWECCRFVRSNAIVIARQRATVGIGGGQPNRVGSVEIAIRNGVGKIKGAALASDAFFPFPDSVERAAKAGISAIIQPGGSIRDKDVIQAADEHGLAMVLTGERRFLH